MTRSATAVYLGSEFNDFLFAPIQEEKNGMALSVLSAMARLDIDPWREAGELARMPRPAASQRLARLIAALPVASSPLMEPGMIACRLVALLPRGDLSSSTVSQTGWFGGSSAAHSAAVPKMIAINLLIMAGMLCAQWALASIHRPAEANTVPAPAVSALQQPTLPPDFAQD